MSTQREFFTGNLSWLKLLAVATMAFDHVALLFISNDAAWRAPGRIAIPIFAILAAYGYEYLTKNRRLYLARLAVFAVLSEPFFWMLFGIHGNAIAAIAFGVAILMVFDWSQNRSGVQCVLAELTVLAGLLFLNWTTSNDSFVKTILLVVSLRFMLASRDTATSILWLVISAFLIFLINEVNSVFFVMAMISLVLVSIFPVVNMKLPQVKTDKWLLYWFYPGHLMVLLLIKP